jgi:transcriptional regulator with XRE-family HTH domain
MREDDIYRALGAQLRARRRLLDMTQSEVAMRCGLTFQQIQKYEAGLVAMPVGRLVTLAQVLDAPVGELVDGAARASTSSWTGERASFAA